MRNQLKNQDAHLLRYGIREIVEVVQKITAIDPTFQVTPENIGDPIAKGWNVPPFLKEIIQQAIAKPDDKVFGYSHSRGLPATRQWVTEYAKRFSPSSTLDPEDVLFTNGLGSAIATFYSMLPPGARILQPTPAYPTHSSLESFATKGETISYQLDPDNEWEPDLANMEEQIKNNPEVTGILVINPNNPTGAVYSKTTLEHIVALAEKYNLMIISDEIYFRMVYNNHEFAQITELAQGKVPLVVMRGLSKDVPWPGARCGWIEFHNTDLDEDYATFAAGVKQRVLMEVCSVTLPQTILPAIYDHPEFEGWLAQYNKELEHNGNNIAEILRGTPGLKVHRPNGAFYMMPLFKDGVLNSQQSLPIANPETKAFIEQEVSKPNFPLDKRFTYYLLAATGICAVPASGFYSPHSGFRITTLDRNEERRNKTYKQLSSAIEEYLAST